MKIETKLNKKDFQVILTVLELSPTELANHIGEKPQSVFHVIYGVRSNMRVREKVAEFMSARLSEMICGNLPAKEAKKINMIA